MINLQLVQNLINFSIGLSCIFNYKIILNINKDNINIIGLILIFHIVCNILDLIVGLYSRIYIEKKEYIFHHIGAVIINIYLLQITENYDLIKYFLLAEFTPFFNSFRYFFYYTYEEGLFNYIYNRRYFSMIFLTIVYNCCNYSFIGAYLLYLFLINNYYIKLFSIYEIKFIKKVYELIYIHDIPDIIFYCIFLEIRIYVLYKTYFIIYNNLNIYIKFLYMFFFGLHVFWIYKICKLFIEKLN